jgi:hypothetical protein
MCISDAKQAIMSRNYNPSSSVMNGICLNVFYFKPYVKLWKSAIITALELTALL